MHRERHRRPQLASIELRQLVERDPEGRRIDRRDIWRESPSEAI